MSDTLTIRQASHTDISSMLELYNYCFFRPWTPNDFQSLLETPSCHGFIALREDHLCGALLFQFAADTADIIAVFVHPDHRRRHIADALMRQTMHFLREHGVESVFLEVQVSNKAGYNFYRTFGCRESGVRKGYYFTEKGREDAIVMKYNCRAMAA